MIYNVYIHIGLHRTGTRSFQSSLLKNRNKLKKKGFDLYKPIKREINSSEIGEAIIDSHKKNPPDSEQKRVLFRQLKERIYQTVKYSTGPNLIISGEDISYIRTDEECDNLKKLFPRQRLTFTMLLVIRDHEEWFNSYAQKILEKKETGTPNSNSRANLDPSGWLTDFDCLVRTLERNFEKTILITYDKEDMLSKLYSALDLDPQGLKTDIRLHKSEKPFARVKKSVAHIKKLIKGSLGFRKRKNK